MTTKKLPDRCCKTCALWDRDEARDAAGRIGKNRMAQCHADVPLIPTSCRVFDKVNPPGKMAGSYGTHCPCYRPRPATKKLVDWEFGMADWMDESVEDEYQSSIRVGNVAQLAIWFARGGSTPSMTFWCEIVDSVITHGEVCYIGLVMAIPDGSHGIRRDNLIEFCARNIYLWRAKE